MENRFDEVAKALAAAGAGEAAGVSRRDALRRVGLGLAGALLASLGLGGRALAAWGGGAACRSYCNRFPAGSPARFRRLSDSDRLPLCFLRPFLAGAALTKPDLPFTARVPASASSALAPTASSLAMRPCSSSR